MISERDGQLYVSGAMNQHTAAALLPAGEALMRQADRVLNLSCVAAVDSSAIAILLGWIRAARFSGRQLSIVESPRAIISLASLYGVTSLLFSELHSEGSQTSVQH